MTCNSTELEIELERMRQIKLIERRCPGEHLIDILEREHIQLLREIQTKEQIVKLFFCGEGFFEPVGLFAHMKTHHKVTIFQSEFWAASQQLPVKLSDPGEPLSRFRYKEGQVVLQEMRNKWDSTLPTRCPDCGAIRIHRHPQNEVHEINCKFHSQRSTNRALAMEQAKKSLSYLLNPK